MAYIRDFTVFMPSLVLIMVCHLLGAKPLSEAIRAFCCVKTWKQFQLIFFLSKFSNSIKWVWKYHLPNGGHFISASMCLYTAYVLTHWGRLTHICVSKLTTIGLDNGLSLDQCQTIIWTNVGILLIGTIGTNFSKILSEVHTFSFTKMHLKISAKWQQLR